MFNKQKQFIAYLLIAVLIIPSVWQLEHVFDNDHGIVYKTGQTNIQKISGQNCSVFHKQLKFQTTGPFFIIDIFSPNRFVKINTVLPQPLYIFSTQYFSLRAPPVLV